MLRLVTGRSGVLVVALAMLVSCTAQDATSPDNQPPIANAKNWSNPATWPSGHVPQAGDSVVIPSGLAVKLDTLSLIHI